MNYQFKNYKFNDQKFEEFRGIKVESDPEVFYGVPHCLVEYERVYNDPYLWFDRQLGVPVVVEKEELMKKIAGTRQFHLAFDKKTKKAREVSKDKAETTIRLKEDLDISKLTLGENNQIFFEEDKKLEAAPLKKENKGAQ